MLCSLLRSSRLAVDLVYRAPAEIGAFRKRSAKRRKFNTPALSMDGKRLENGALRKRWHFGKPRFQILPVL